MQYDVLKRSRHGHSRFTSTPGSAASKRRSGSPKPRRRTGRLESLEARQLLVADLVISEFMASPTNAPGNIQDQNGDYSDWIEIHNTTPAPINLAGWSLTDKSNDLDQWVFPNQTLAANGYLVVFASEKDLRTPGQELHTNFKLGGGGEYLALVAPDGLTFGSQFTPEYPDQFNNISYGPNSTYTANGYFTTPSPGQPNTTEPIADPTRRIEINEIMYHPQTENDQHEFIELVNRGTQTVNLAGWQFTAGVDYTFGNVSLAPNQFLVVAANTTAFTARYGAVASLVGGWTGTLSNTGETIRLRDNTGNTVSEVAYADQGNWANRVELNVGGNSWEWESLSDGGGRSLELRNWQLSNDVGQNWGQSNGVNGTPGAQNSLFSTNIAPLISNVDQSVAIPNTTTAVTITADIQDESATGLVVNLRWRTGTGTFNTLTMFDDGAHGDGIAGDREYGATIGAQSVDGTIVEYYVEARDSSNQTRTWPAPGRRTTGQSEQVVNALFRVDNTLAATANNAWTPGSEPIFVLITTAAEYSRFDALSNNSDAQAFATFVSIDGTGTSVRHQSGFRIRGASSRSYDPPPLRVELPHDNPWHGYSDFNLNSRYPEIQLLGSAVLRDAGLQASAGTRLQMRVNGVNGAFGGQPPRFGSYLWLEPYNSEFLDKHIPGDSGGNIYKKVRPLANWAWRNGNVAQYMADGWSKSTNSSENNWSDLDTLFRIFNLTGTGPDYYPDISAVANVDQWVRWFAAMEMLNSRETNLSNGADDDYQMYHGVNDPRFILLPHDLDTILGQGDTGSSATQPFFDAIANDGESMASVLTNFFNDPIIVRKYYQAIKDIAETTFATSNINALIDDYLVGYMTGTTGEQRIAAMRTYAAQRAAYALSIIPQTFTVSSALPLVNGYRRATTSTTTLSGTANVLETVSVRVDGQLATWNGRTGQWTSPTLTLLPGINRIMVQTYDGFNASGNKTNETFIDVWYDDASTSSVSGVLDPGLNTWSAAAGPYVVTGNITVPSGATLVIQPGTTVFFNTGTNLTVNAGGTIIAEGNEYNRIHFTRTPGTNTTNWGGIRINSTNDNRFSWFNEEYVGGSGARGFRVDNGRASFDHGMWLNNTVSAVEGSGSSFRVTNSFVGGGGFESLHATSVGGVSGEILVQGNTFGPSTGYTDTIDFTGAQYGQTLVPQIIDNVFLGSEDDFLDFDGNDAVVIGNVFMGSGLADDDLDNLDTSSAVSGGKDQSSPRISKYWVMGNYFYDNDHAVLAKEGNSVVLVNNTIIKNRLSTVNFDEPGNNTAGPGAAGYLENNIIWDSPIVIENATPNTQVALKNNIVPTNPYSGTGPGNIDIDPHLVKMVNITDLKRDLQLLAGGPGVGTGTQGQDRGAAISWGIPIGGEPPAQTAQTSATLEVGNPFWVSYKYRVNGGAWSAETPVATPIQLTGLANGTYTVQVVGKNYASVWTPDAQATSSKTWTVNTALSSIIINEVLANNTTAAHAGVFPDMIELYNAGAAQVNLGGMSITDTTNNKVKYQFPAGTLINPGQYLVLYGDSVIVPGEIHVGFNLDGSGDGVYLYNAAQTLVDSVEFGQQLANYSVGRIGQDRHWELNQPTLGSANIRQATGRTDTLKINEWFADGDIRFSDDYIELYNPDTTLPVALAGLHLTDEAVGAPKQYAIPALSYVSAGGFVAFHADGDTGGDHLPFQLSADFEYLGLADATGKLIDKVLYRPQTTDITQGRQPDGSSTKVFDTLPTPDVANPIPPVPTLSTLIGWNSSWRFNEAGDQGTAWRGPAFNDTGAPGWEDGTGIIGRFVNVPRSAIPLQSPGTLPGNPPGNTNGTNLDAAGRTTYYFRKTINIPVNATQVRFQHLVDDGAIIYVNGVELVNASGQIQRFNMTSGAYSYSTTASASITTANSYSGVIEIPLSMLNLGGSNLISVEVHQGPGSTDAMFGMYMEATTSSQQQTNVPSRAPGLFAGLRVTEIMYNPLGGNQYEYIELQNTGAQSIDMTGVRLSDAVDFTFPAMTLAAGARTVVAANVAAFQSRYGNAINVAGFYAGDLGNGGEDLVLELPDPYDAGILRFDYNDTWYPNTDGAGYALVVNNTSTAARDWDQRTTWRSSSNIFGSPGGVDPVPASVNGQIFNDTNANGVQNAGETGRADVPVSLYFAGVDGIFGGAGDVLVGTVNTNATGDYSFTGLAPGAYYLSALPPAGLGFSPIDQGGNDALDSDFDQSTRRTAVFTLSAGQNDTSRDGLLSSAGPSVDIVDVAPDPRVSSVGSISIVFDQPVAGFDLADLALTRNGGANLLTAAQTLSTTDNITWTLGNLAGLTNPAGAYVLTLSGAGSGITGSASGLPIVAGATDSFTVLNATVNGRHIFYNESSYDGADPAANAADDGAIAPDKQALLPGGTATFANYTSYSRGINGIMIDVAGLANAPTAGDFTFRAGNDNTPGAWAVVPTAPSISVRSGAGVGGSDRITLNWPNFSITKKWLQVTMNTSTNTGIRTPDVFYFGNAVGEAGNSSTDARVTSTDEILARNNPRTIANPADILNNYDFNRDMRVSATDQILARNNRTTFADMLNLIQVPAALQAGGLSDGADAVIAQGLVAQPLDEASSLTTLSLSSQPLIEQPSPRQSAATSAAFAHFATAAKDQTPRRSVRTAAVADDLLDLLVAR